MVINFTHLSKYSYIVKKTDWSSSDVLCAIFLWDDLGLLTCSQFHSCHHHQASPGGLRTSDWNSERSGWRLVALLRVDSEACLKDMKHVFPYVTSTYIQETCEHRMVLEFTQDEWQAAHKDGQHRLAATHQFLNACEVVRFQRVQGKGYSGWLTCGKLWDQ